MKLTFGTSLFTSLLVILVSSCTKDTEITKENLSCAPVHANATNVLNSGAPGDEKSKALQTELLKSVHSANARFHSSSLAIAEGYQPDNHCVSVPGLGGMGFHWANPSLVDTIFNPLQPEVLLYANGPGGNLRLIGVEYLVINAGQAVPMFGNQPFQVGGTPLPLPHWSLHAWVYEPNPSGTFAPFNPNITCQ